MTRVITALVCWSILCLMHGAIPALGLAQELFLLQLIAPNGIAEDPQGHINVHSDDVNTTLLTKFDRTGNQIAQTTLGDNPIEALSFVGSRLATDTATNRLYLMSPNGMVVIFRSNTLNDIDDFDIQDLSLDTNNVFNISTGSSSSFSLSSNASYGDIAVFRPPSGQASLFVTGLSGQTPFVLRIPLGQSISQAEVVLMSDHPFPPSLSFPRGIAVNSGGTGLTTFPSPESASGCPDIVVTFSANSPATTAASLTDYQRIPSSGMTIDIDDNFYIATGGVGISSCIENGNGILVFLNDSLSNMEVRSLQATSGTPLDVAVSPTEGEVYMTVGGNSSAVVRFDSLASFASTP